METCDEDGTGKAEKEKMSEWIQFHYANTNKLVMVRLDKIVRFQPDVLAIEDGLQGLCTKIVTVDDEWIKVAESYDEVKEMICQGN